jgi:hypothetical protein
MAPEDTLTHVNLDALYATPGDDLSEIVTLDEAARRAGVTRRTLNRWINAGHLQVLPGAGMSSTGMPASASGIGTSLAAKVGPVRVSGLTR